MQAPQVARLPATLLRTYRAAGVVRRARHELELRSGVIRRRTPVAAELPPDPGGTPRLGHVDGNRLRQGYARLPNAADVREQIVAEAERVLEGELCFYGGHWVEVGWPPAWRRNPESGHEHPREVHWSQVSDHDLVASDIKDVWEPSRFGWACTLVRAFAVTGEGRYAEAFWEALEDWVSDNPPNCGPNWRCGQEASIRAMAVLFALRALRGHPSCTSARVSLVRRLLLATGRRVTATLAYALSQRNNHAISEAAVLYALGVVFPAWPDAARWRGVGWRHLRSTVIDQFYPDGAYAQHSVTYQRLAVQTLGWALVVSREAGARLPEEAVAAVRCSVGFLHALQAEQTGQLPNLGANDGAMLLPLSTCDYRDFRPVLGTASVLIGQGRLYEPGPWDEESLWLAGTKAVDAEPRSDWPERPTRLVALHGGLLVTRGGSTTAVFRISPAWRHRPGQADDCHVDVWIKGVEVAGGAGTYRYTASPPWDNGLAASRVHNTVTIDGGDRLRRIGRFLSTDWPRTRILLDAGGEDWQCWVAESDVPVWKPLAAAHRRLLLRVGERILIGDLVGVKPPRAPQVSWNLPAVHQMKLTGRDCQLSGEDWCVRILGPLGTSYENTVGGPGPKGWHAPTYAVLKERCTLTARLPVGQRSLVVTLFDPALFKDDSEQFRTYVSELMRDPSERRAEELAVAVERPLG